MAWQGRGVRRPRGAEHVPEVHDRCVGPVTDQVAPPRKRGAAQDALLTLLRRPEGATIAEMQAAIGWPPHSVRGALSGLIGKKLGHKVAGTKEERGRVYRIAN
ncbi:MAG: hypothetical protein JWM75_1334 [Sphingomonas bacterium]|nr:hypothetical protein [Sphingomonas bacterium]